MWVFSVCLAEFCGFGICYGCCVFCGYLAVFSVLIWVFVCFVADVTVRAGYLIAAVVGGL